MKERTAAEQAGNDYIREQGFEDCLNQRTHPGTPVGECSQNMLCGCQIHASFMAGVKWADDQERL